LKPKFDSEIAQRDFRSAMHALFGVLVIAFALLTFYLTSARPYPNAHALYSDCAAGDHRQDGALERRLRCARYLQLMLDNWYLSQSSAICSRYTDEQLSAAYVAYWQRRGLGIFFGLFRSAESSAKEFLDSQAEPCSGPNPSLHPP
jgi:hypothetical protein